MARELTTIEKDYITNNHKDLSAKELCAEMPGVGVKTVENFIKTGVMPEEKKGQTPEERIEDINQATGLKTGDLMARNPEKGFAIMTPPASELSDARRVANIKGPNEMARQKSNKIFIMNKDKQVR